MVSKKLTVRIVFAAIIIILFWLLLQYSKGGDKTKEDSDLSIAAIGHPVTVAVYYEALCPDSKHFVLKELKPAYEQLPQFIDIQFVPYGKATTSTNPDGSLAFKCQHGHVECEANIIHACVIERVADPAQRLQIIACMIADNVLPKDIFHECAARLKVEDTESIQQCYDGPHGAELLKGYGEMTHALRPKVHFIPTVTLDGDQRRQETVLREFFKEVCRVLGGRGPKPEACRG